VGLTPPTAQWILIAISVSAALFFLGERVDALLQIGVLAQTRAHLSPSIDTEVGLIGLFIVMGVLLPIPLEIYFRGVVFTYLRNLFGLEAGIGVSALIYGLTYFNPALPIHVGYGVVHGAVFAVLYARSGSLWTAIVANGTLGLLVVAKAAWG
jgi:membrane protease YdiL (CAAX protease family)